MGKRKPAPHIDHPYVFSVSQIETFLLCNRKWAYFKIDGEEDPGNEASQLGGEVHSELEDYLQDGKPIKAARRSGKIAMTAVPHLPPPRFPGMQIEDWFFLKIGTYQGKHGVGCYIRGLKDIQILSGWKTWRPFVSDHKTTKNFMWAKTEEDLNGGDHQIPNIQAGTYAFDAMEQSDKDEVDLQWTYMRTTGPPIAEPRCSIINREQAKRTIDFLEVVTADMIRIKDENPTAETVEQNPQGCEAFGGCPFQGKCNLTPQEQLRAMIMQKQKESGVLGKLAARKAAKNTSATTEKASTEVVATPKKITEKSEQESEEIDEATDAAINPPENEEAPVVTVETIQAKEAEKAAAKASKTSKAKSAKTTVVEPFESSGLLGKAVDAFLNVFIEEIANRVRNKL